VGRVVIGHAAEPEQIAARSWTSHHVELAEADRRRSDKT
jgi:hypothetical protein